MSPADILLGAVAFFVLKDVAIPAAGFLGARFLGKTEKADTVLVALVGKVDGLTEAVDEMRTELRLVREHQGRLAVLEDWRKAQVEELRLVRERQHDLANHLQRHVLKESA